MNEYELGAAIEAAWLPHGATTHIHYLAATSMAAPELCVPAQWPSDRRLQTGDALVFEVSASFWEYPAQRLGTVFVDAEPTPLYRELLSVAEATFDAVVARLRAGATAAELWQAAGGITIRDDLVHGFVGGYLPPVLGARRPVPTDFLRGRHDRRGAAERGHARRACGRAGRRAAAGHARRRGAAARKRPLVTTAATCRPDAPATASRA